MKMKALVLATLSVFVAVYLAGDAGAREQRHRVAGDTSAFRGVKNMETATFAAGCFWCIEEAFRQVDGVRATSAGYTGGHKKNPTYREVCTGRTGHAEAVEVVFDPKVVSYEELLELFWNLHDPTQRNRQGPDIGHQYRSAIFYHSREQEQAARESMKALAESGKYRRPIVTEIVPAQTFWRAEEYHQQYRQKARRSLGSM